MTIDLSTLITKEDKFATLQKNKVNELSRACHDSIVEGFNSSALGKKYHYPAAAEDQTNLLSRVVQAQLNASDAKWTAVLSCQDSKGNWGKVFHSAKQVISVASDATQDVQDKTAQYTALSAQVTSAKTDADVAAVSWVYPPKA